MKNYLGIKEIEKVKFLSDYFLKFKSKLIFYYYNRVFQFFLRYMLPIIVILLITIYYFQSLFGLNGVLAYNDYVLPKSQQDLDAYLNNFTIYSINTNLGGVRSNFLSEIPTIIIIKLLSFFFDYQFATKLTQVFSFAMSGIAFFVVLLKINKSSLLSLILSLLAIFNLWSFDRLQQGHFYLLGPFLIVFVFIIYYRYFSIKNYRFLLLGHLLFLALFTYYHYAIIILYLLFFDFIIEFILSKERYNLLKGNLTIILIFLIDSLIFILPYSISALSTFKNLSENISNISDLRLFSWQSMAISEFFHIRLGMYSFALNSETWIMISLILGFVGLYYFFIYGENEDRYKYVEFRLKSAFLFFGFLAFGVWLNFDVFANIIYKIPTFAIFRDMNKFVGISFFLFIFLISLKVQVYFNQLYRYRFKVLVFICSATLFIANIIIPYNMFLVYNQDEIYNIKDDSLYTVASFPSYPITGVYYNDVYFHKYLPSLVATNDSRTISIPYLVQQSQYPKQTELFKEIYRKFDVLTKDQIYEKFSKFGVKYFIFYKRYDFITKVPVIDSWYHKIDLQQKFGADEIIFENNDITVYKLPDKYIKSFINTDNPETEVFYKIRSNTEIELEIKSSKSFNLQHLVNQDRNWILKLSDSGKGFGDKCENQINKNTFECKINNNPTYNFISNLKLIFGTQNLIGDRIQNNYGINEWNINLQEIEEEYKLKRDNNDDLIINASIIYLPNAYFNLGVLIFIINVVITSVVIIKLKTNG